VVQLKILKVTMDVKKEQTMENYDEDDYEDFEDDDPNAVVDPELEPGAEDEDFS